MSVSIELLQSIEIFSSLAREELEKINQIVNPMNVLEGETLAKKGRISTTFFINVTGSFLIDFENKKALTLHDKGDVMGWSTLVTPFEYRGTLVSLTNGEVLTISGEEFYRLLQGDSSLGGKIMKKINRIAASRASLSEA
jgi:CRP-like cAMP-binding protein